MKKRIVSILTTLCLVVGLCSVLGIQADAYSTGHPNTHVNTGDQRTDVIMIAETQLGYAEDPGTKYGAWWGEKNGVGSNFVNEAWCVMFAHWCMDQAGCTSGYSGLSALSSSLLNQYRSGKNGNTAYKFGSGYMPRPGDLIFVGSGEYTDHVGIVTSVTDTMIYTIEGNYNDKVSRSSYDLSTGRRSGSLRSIIYFGVPAYTNDPTTPEFDGPVVTPPEPQEPETPDTGINYKTQAKTGLNVRTEPKTTAQVITSLYAGQEVTIVDEADGDNGYKWGKLSTGGWICLYYTTKGSDQVETPEAPETPETPDTTFESYDGTVSCDVLNVRSGAGTGNSVVKRLYHGDKVTITEATTVSGTEWGKLSDGGWVATKYITKTETPEEPEVPEQPETPEEPETPEQPETPETPETPEQPTTPISLTGKITASLLNIRSAPVNGSILGTYAKGQTVTIVEVQEIGGKDWGKTDKGWISMSYVKVDTVENPTPDTPDVPETPSTPAEGTECTVTGSALNVRSGAGTNYGVISSVYKGQTVTIVETKTVSGTTWGRMASGGWISLQYTNYGGTTTPEVPETPETPATPETPGTSVNITGTITASILNVRATPGTGSVVSKLYKGQSVTVTETKIVDGTTWGKTSSGWISMDYVSTSGNSNGGTASGVKCTITGDTVNVRTGAGTNYPVTSTVTRGQTVTIVANAYDTNGNYWGQLSSGGWVSMTYVA